MGQSTHKLELSWSTTLRKKCTKVTPCPWEYLEFAFIASLYEMLPWNLQRILRMRRIYFLIVQLTKATSYIGTWHEQRGTKANVVAHFNEFNHWLFQYPLVSTEVSTFHKRRVVPQMFAWNSGWIENTEIQVDFYISEQNRDRWWRKASRRMQSWSEIEQRWNESKEIWVHYKS